MKVAVTIAVALVALTACGEDDVLVHVEVVGDAAAFPTASDAGPAKGPHAPPTKDAAPSPLGRACRADVDCADPGFACGYAITGGCSAKGSCQPLTPSAACSVSAICACDGTWTKSCDLNAPNGGFVHKPVSPFGICDGGAP